VRRVGDLEICRPAGRKSVGRIVIATLQKTPRQNAHPPLPLLQPGARWGRTVQDRLLGRIAQEGAAWAPALQGLGSTGPLTPRSTQATHVHAPMRSEGIAPPSVARPCRPLVDHVRQRGGPSGPGAGLAQMPPQGARRDHAGGPEGAHAMAERLGRAFCGRARVDRRGGRAAVEQRPPGFCRGADAAAAWLGEAPGLERALTERLRLGRTGGRVAGAPVHAPVRFAGGRLPETPEAGATQRRQPMLGERSAQVVQTPAGGRTRSRGRFPGRHGQYRHPVTGGKRAAGAPRAAYA
jgi:hypothetical protein